jgi:hypothetical protein
MMRIVRDGGDMVLVYQAEGGDAPALVFESTGRSVSLVHFPQDWRRLNDAELLSLRVGCGD